MVTDDEAPSNQLSLIEWFHVRGNDDEGVPII